MIPGLKRVVEQSGLTRVELSLVYGVTRQTLHYWITKGPPRAGTYTARMAEVITGALVASIDRGVLPLPVLSSTMRAGRVKRMAEISQALKPAPLK